MNDYIELDLYLDEDSENYPDVYVYLNHREFYVFENVTSNPVRYQGFWSIHHMLFSNKVTSNIEDSKVKYFTVISKEDNNSEHNPEMQYDADENFTEKTINNLDTKKFSTGFLTEL